MLACMVCTFVGAGLGYSVRSLYTAPITAELGITRTAYNLSYTVASLFGMIINFNFGRIKSALGSYRRVALIGMLLMALAGVLGSNSTSLFTVYLTTICITLAFNWVGSIPMTGILKNWFPKNNGLALGIVLSGTSLGGSIFSPVVSGWISYSGWRSAYLYGTIIIGIGFLFVLFTLKDSPDGTTQTELKKKKYKFDTTLLKNKNFYLIGLAQALMPFSLQAVSLQAPTIIADAGHPIELAGTISSVMFASCAVSKIISGWMNDKLGLPVTRTILICCGCVGVSSLIFAKNVPMLYCYAIFYGIGQSLALMFMPLHIRYVFPDNDPAEVMGPMTAFGLVGMLATPAFSFFQELTGSYTGVLLFCTGTLVMVAVLAGLARPNRPAGNPKHLKRMENY